MKINTSLSVSKEKLKKYDLKRGLLSRSDFFQMAADYIIKHQISLETLMSRPAKRVQKGTLSPYKSYKSPSPPKPRGSRSDFNKGTSSPSPPPKLTVITNETSFPPGV